LAHNYKKALQPCSRHKRHQPGLCTHHRR
jgi:hypothetical protein